MKARINGVIVDNVITNGDFSSGVSDWADTFSTNSVASNILTNTASGGDYYAFAEQSLPSVTSGDKWYFKFRARVTNSDCTSFSLNIYTTVNEWVDYVFTPIQNQWYEFTAVHTIANSSVTPKLQIFHVYPDAATANGKELEIDGDFGVFAINLTESYGAGFELSRERVTTKLAKYGFFEGQLSTADDYDIILREGRPLRLAIAQDDLIYSDVTIDFTGATASELPQKYQEIKILDDDDSVLHIGLVNEVKLPTFDRGGNKPLHVQLNLINLRISANKRSISTIIKSESLFDAVESILQPLIDDGYTIAFNDLDTTKEVSATIIKRPIESVMNEWGVTYNFLWYMDEFKNIYIKDILTLDGLDADYTIDNTCNEFEEQVDTLTPRVESIDYANVINLKNIKLLRDAQYLTGLSDEITVEQDEILYFQNPFWYSETAGAKRFDETSADVDYLRIDIDDGTSNQYLTYYDFGTGSIVADAEFGFEGVDNEDAAKKILLVRDLFNQNIIVGFKNNFGVQIKVEFYSSECFLIPHTFTYYDTDEIMAQAPKMGTTGQVEKTISLNNQFLTTANVFDTARGSLVQANTGIAGVTIGMSGEDLENLGIELTEKILINKPELLIEGLFIITAIQKNILLNNTDSEKYEKYRIHCKNVNFNYNYYNAYRRTPIQEDENQVLSNAYGIFVEDERLIQKQQILLDGVLVNED